MFERYEASKLFVATIRNIFIADHAKKDGQRVYKIVKTKRKGIIYNNNGSMYDITRPEEDIYDNTLFHRVSIDDLEPLYDESKAEKVVSKRQAFKRYSKIRKLTNNS